MMRLARHIDRFRKTQVPSRFRVISVGLALLAILLLLLPQTAGHHGAACFVLLPVLLFGTVELSVFGSGVERDSRDRVPQAPDLAALFQRPPPPVIA